MKLKLSLTTIATLSLVWVLSSCGSAEKTNTSDTASDSESIEQAEADENTTSSIDWDVVMPKIVRNLPKETVDSYFSGKIGADSIDYGDYKACPYVQNFYSQWDECQETHYVFTVLAAPYADSNEVLVIVNSQAGVDGVGTLLLKTMNYNLETGEFSNISDKIPGVEPDAELLDLSWLSEHPDWIKQIKRDYIQYSTYDLSAEDGICKVQNTFNDNDICYFISDEMSDDVPDWFDRLSLVYVWNGKRFELEKKK